MRPWKLVAFAASTDPAGVYGAGEVRLDPHTTKNGDGRVFPRSPRS